MNLITLKRESSSIEFDMSCRNVHFGEVQEGGRGERVVSLTCFYGPLSFSPSVSESESDLVEAWRSAKMRMMARPPAPSDVAKLMEEAEADWRTDGCAEAVRFSWNFCKKLNWVGALRRQYARITNSWCRNCNLKRREDKVSGVSAYYS